MTQSTASLVLFYKMTTVTRKRILRKKLVILGEGACDLLVVFSNKQLRKGSIPTGNYVASIEVDKEQVELVMWDTVGQENLDNLRLFAYPDTDVILLCFSISSPNSFYSISEKWAQEVKRFCPNAPIILVGNKKNLRDDPNTIKELASKNQEPVKTEEGKDMAVNISAIAYLECCVKTKEGMTEVLETVTRASLQVKKKRKSVKCSVI